MAYTTMTKKQKIDLAKNALDTIWDKIPEGIEIDYERTAKALAAGCEFRLDYTCAIKYGRWRSYQYRVISAYAEEGMFGRRMCIGPRTLSAHCGDRLLSHYSSGLIKRYEYFLADANRIAEEALKLLNSARSLFFELH